MKTFSKEKLILEHYVKAAEEVQVLSVMDKWDDIEDTSE